MCILLVFLTYVYHDARFGECKAGLDISSIEQSGFPNTLLFTYGVQ
jgi:hypothetical protein